MTRSFVHEAASCRVVFGAGTLAHLPEEVARLNTSRVLVLTTPGRIGEARRLVAALGGSAVGIFAEAAMHTPTGVTEHGLKAARRLGADGLLSIGGGSAIGLCKAIALRTGLPQIVVPTTYAGSEMTSILGETRDGAKTTLRDPRVLPKTVIYDVDLTLGLSVAVSSSSGINAIAHAAEALYAPDRTPIVTIFAREGIAALARALPAIAADPLDRAARSKALFGAWLCGSCLGATSMGLHHKLCHVLGGSFGLPHAETHAAVLPHALAYNAAFAPDAAADAARALDVPGAADGLFDLVGRLGLARALRDLGMPETSVGRAAELAVAATYPNPRPIERGAVEAMIRRAWAGERPGT